MIRIPKQPTVDYEGQDKELNFINDDYEVTVNSIKCDVKECRVSAIPFNRVWPGKQRSKDQTELASFITFSADEEVTLNVKCKRNFENAVIRPISKDISLKNSGQEIEFTLKEPGAYVLELDGEHFALHIFFNPIREYDKKENADYYFGPGIHFPGVIKLLDNQSVYVDDEAIVFGSIFAESAENIRIYGGGVIDGSTEERIYEHCYKDFTKGNIKLYNCKNIRIEDVILKNSAIWTISLFDCDNVKIDNIKIIGQWRYNTDGIDICNTSNVLIKNSFIRAFDDVITIKGIYDFGVIENIVVDNCVMWCGWGRNAEIGAETAAEEMKNIVFKNCDLIHSSAVALDIQNCHYAKVHDVLYENINVEYQKGTLPEIYQNSDDMIYDGYGKTGVPVFINIQNRKGYEFISKNDKNIKYGTVYDIIYRNINVFTDNNQVPFIKFVSNDENAIFDNIILEKFYVNGTLVEPISYFDTEIKNVTNMEGK